MNINVISVFPEIIEASMHGLTGKAFGKKASLELFDLKSSQKQNMEVSMILHMVAGKVWLYLPNL